MERPTLADIDAVFGALAHEARRHVLVLLAQRGGELSSGYLAARFPHSWPTTTRHLKVLEEAGLVQVHYEGRSSLYSLRLERLCAVVHSWLGYLQPTSSRRTWAATGPRTTRGLQDRSSGKEGDIHDREQLHPKDLPGHAGGRRHRTGGRLLRKTPGHPG